MKIVSLFLFLFCFASSVLAQVKWHCADSTVRIRFSLSEKHHPNVIVPVPRELSPKDVAVYSDKHKQLQATPVKVNGKIVAVAVNGASLSVSTAPNASVYLLDKPLAKPLPYAGSPVHFQRMQRDLTTRAHEADEMLRMIANLHLIPYPHALKSPSKVVFRGVDMPAFGNVKRFPRWLSLAPKKPRPFLRSFSVSTAYFNVAKKSKVSFGTNQLQVGWTILLDAKPIANWCDAGDDGMGAFVELEPGLHSLQLVVAQNSNEPFPQLLMKADGKDAKPAAMTGLLPAMLPGYLGIETKGKAIASAGTRLEFTKAYAFTHAEGAPVLCSYTAIPGKSKVQYLDDAKRALPHIEPNLYLTENGKHPIVRLELEKRAYTFEQLPATWQPPTAVVFDMRLKTPAIVGHEAPFNLDVKLQSPTMLPPAFRKQLKLHIVQRAGKDILAEQTLTMPNDVATLALHLKRLDSTVDVTCSIGNTTVTERKRVVLMTPRSALALRAQGQQLFYNDDLASIVLNPSLPCTTPLTATGMDAIYDDFLLTAVAPGADVLPQTFQLFTAKVPSGTDSALAFFADFHKLLNAKPKPRRAFILINPVEAHRNSTGWIAKLDYAVSACRFAGIRPMLVILPDLPGIAPRLHAFNAKALSLHLAGQGAVETCDLYTVSQLKELNTSSWKTANGLRLETINNDARQWLFNHLK